MSAYDIQGKNCVFQLKIGDEYMTVICAKSFSLTVATEMKDTTTVGGLGTGWWKEKRPRKLEYSISFNGTVQAIADGDKPTIKTMLQNQVWFLPMDYRIIYKDNSDNVIVILGRVYNANTAINASAANLLDGTVELQGTGAIEIKDALPNPVNLRLLMVDDGTGNQVGKARLVLQDADGNIVFQTDDLPGAVAGYIEGPAFDITTTIESGQYYYTWYAYTETDANLFHLDDPPGITTAFANGFQDGTSYPTTLHDFTAPREIEWSLGPSVPLPECVNVAIVGSPSAPDGVVGQSYSYSYSITGSAPFALSNVTKPSWLNVNIDQTNKLVILTGTPDVAGSDIEVSFDITNCVSGIVNFSDAINVAENPDAVTVNWSHTVDTGGNLTIFKNGDLILSQNVDGSGSFVANPGDVIQVDVTGSPEQNCHLEISNTVDGEIFNESSIAIVENIFTIVSGRDYSIISEVTNI